MTSYRLFENQQLPGPLPFVITVPEGWDLYDNPLPHAVLAAMEPPTGGYRSNVIVSVLKATPVEEALELATEPMLIGEAGRTGTLLAEQRADPIGEPGVTPSGFRTIAITVDYEGGQIALDQTHVAVLLPVNFDRAVPRTLAVVATAASQPGEDPKSLSTARELIAALGLGPFA